jgi:hypothetical protein
MVCLSVFRYTESTAQSETLTTAFCTEAEHAVRPSVHSSALENLPTMSELMVRKSYDDGPWWTHVPSWDMWPIKLVHSDLQLGANYAIQINVQICT